ncbi:hypothetical protein CAAN3_03S08790 [[Candida] anglica]
MKLHKGRRKRLLQKIGWVVVDSQEKFNDQAISINQSVYPTLPYSQLSGPPEQLSSSSPTPPRKESPSSSNASLTIRAKVRQMILSDPQWKERTGFPSHFYKTIQSCVFDVTPFPRLGPEEEPYIEEFDLQDPTGSDCERPSSTNEQAASLRYKRWHRREALFKAAQRCQLKKE